MERKAVRLCITRDNLEAQMILNVLEDEHIPAYKKDLGSAQIMNLYGGNSSFGEEIYVAEDDACRAMDIIRGMGYEGYE